MGIREEQFQLRQRCDLTVDTLPDRKYLRCTFDTDTTDTTDNFN